MGTAMAEQETKTFDATQAERNIEKMIDRLKGLCSQSGLGNQACEEEVITNVFIYKFLNDKMLYNLGVFAEEREITIDEVLADRSESGWLDEFYDEHAFDVRIEPEQMIGMLAGKVDQADFPTQVDQAFEDIAANPANKQFNIERDDGSEVPLLTKITTAVSMNQRATFAKTIFSIITEYSFVDVFGTGSFDFFSRIFEYLIKDYNVASGKYAEYFTPQNVSRIIAKCLVGMRENIDALEICDPFAGSGSLVLHLAHELGRDTGLNKAKIYTQDISAKSTRFCRLNMILNGFSDSLDHIAQGDTLLNPMHYQQQGDPQSGLRKFGAITANPPFNLDFSATRDAIANGWAKTNRFFAGVPTIPGKKKESMAIYLCAIQHILYSLEDDGISAIVLPSGFLTKTNKIEKAIKKEIVDKHILRGVITMPPNIFANTPTSVSVLFLDKAQAIDPSDEKAVEEHADDKVILIDASHLGHIVKEGGNQRTVLSEDEEIKVIETFASQTAESEFSIAVDYATIAEEDYSISPGQYFPVRIIYQPITKEEFSQTIQDQMTDLNKLFERHDALKKSMFAQMEKVSWHEED